MFTKESLNNKIQALETLYAESLGAGASTSELTRIWNKIKELKRESRSRPE
jgi:hypothetical protein